MPLSEKQRALIDRLGELRRRVDEFAPVKKEAETVAAEVMTFLPTKSDPDKQYTLEGNTYNVQVSPRQEQQRISDIRGLFKFFGQSKFLSICTVPFKLIDTLLTSDEKSRFVVKERTGHRTLKTVARAQETAAAPRVKAA